MKSVLPVWEFPPPSFPDVDRRERFLALCPRLEAIFARYAEAEHMPGVAYGVVVDDELIFSHSLGVRNIATQSPVTRDTIFRIASMTKSFAALAVVMLRDEGRLRLDDAVAIHVPELADLAGPTSDSPAITVRHLLTMTPGFPTDDPWGDRQLYRNDAAMSALYRAGLVFAHPPGVAYEYSNLGYMLLGRVITNVSGEPALDFITRKILRPLAMTSTVWNAAEAAPEQLALGYRWEDGAWEAEPLLPSGGDVAAFAGLFTSIADLARWVALFLGAWPPRSEDDAHLARRSSLREMQQISRAYAPRLVDPRLGETPRLTAGGYGFGLSIAHNGTWESVGHGGGLPGFGSHMRWSPTHGVGVLALSNVTYGNTHNACYEALDLLVRGSQAQPRRHQAAPALRAAQRAVLRLMESWDDALADALFADNFFLDTTRERWQRSLAELRQRHGALRPQGDLMAQSWLTGKWKMQGERGWCWLSILLTPTNPPLVQVLEIESILPPTPAMYACAERLADVTTHPIRRNLRRLCAAGAAFDALWQRVQLAHGVLGQCRLGDLLAGDGVSFAKFSLINGKVAAEVELTFDARGRLRDLIFRPAEG